MGSELHRTQGKRGGIQGNIGASTFPSSFCVASASGNIFARSLTLIPRSLHRNLTETLASQAKSPLVFFSSSVFRSRSSIWTPGTSTWLFSILPLPGPRTQEPSNDRLLPLLVCLFLFLFLFFYFCWCLLSHFTFKGFCCVFFFYTYYVGIQTNCSIFLASKSSVHSFTVKTLVIFHVTHHVTALDQ